MRNRSRRGRMWLRATHNGDFAVVRGCPGYEERTMSCHSSYDSERAAGIHGDFALGSPRTVRQSLGKQENGPRNCANRSASHSPPHSEMHWNLFLVPWQGWSDNGCGWSGSGTACFQEICQSGTFRTAISHHPDMVLTLCCPLRRQAMNNNPGLNLEGHSRPACGNDDGIAEADILFFPGAQGRGCKEAAASAHGLETRNGKIPCSGATRGVDSAVFSFLRVRYFFVPCRSG